MLIIQRMSSWGGFFATVGFIAVVIAVRAVIPEAQADKIRKGILSFANSFISAEEELPISGAKEVSSQAAPAVSSAKNPGEIVLTKEVAAYDPANSLKQIGLFLKGTRLEIVGPAQGGVMTQVRCVNSDGRTIVAVCLVADLAAAR